MKGKIDLLDNNWIVKYIHYDFPPLEYMESEYILPLHPEDIKQIDEDSKVFDNIIARIKAYPNVEFIIMEECPHYDGSHFGKDCSCKSGFIKYAKLLKN